MFLAIPRGMRIASESVDARCVRQERAGREQRNAPNSVSVNAHRLGRTDSGSSAMQYWPCRRRHTHTQRRPHTVHIGKSNTVVNAI